MQNDLFNLDCNWSSYLHLLAWTYRPDPLISMPHQSSAKHIVRSLWRYQRTYQKICWALILRKACFVVVLPLGSLTMTGQYSCLQWREAGFCLVFHSTFQSPKCEPSWSEKRLRLIFLFSYWDKENGHYFLRVLLFTLERNKQFQFSGEPGKFHTK